MEFDTNFREDLPLLSTLLSDQYQSPFKVEDQPNNNGLIPLHHSTNSSKLPLLFQNYNNGGSISLPFSDIPTQSVDPFGSKLKGLLFNYSMPNFSVSDDNTQNKPMHNGFLSSLWDYNNPQGINQIQQPNVRSHIYPPPSMGINTTGFPKDFNISCKASTDQIGNSNDHQKIRRTHMVMRNKGGGNRSSKKSNIIKGQWTPHEDKMLLKLVERYGDKKWAEIAKIMEGRIGKQCRERWHNHLRPHIRKDTWSEEEDKVLIEAHKEMGNKWAEIARRLPGRSENTIKNHWNATKRRQISKKKNNNKDSNKNTNKSNQASSLLQNYIISLINSSSSTSTTSITTNPPPSHDHDHDHDVDDDDDDNNIADQYLNIITYTGVDSSDVSSGTDQWEAHQLLFNDDHNNKAAAIDVVASDNCDRSRMFSESNNYLLDGQEMLQPSGSGINYNDNSSMDLDLDLDLDLLEMIIFQGNSDQF